MSRKIAESDLARCLDGIAMPINTAVISPNLNHKNYVVRFAMPSEERERSMQVCTEDAADAVKTVLTAYPSAQIKSVN